MGRVVTLGHTLTTVRISRTYLIQVTIRRTLVRTTITTERRQESERERESEKKMDVSKLIIHVLSQSRVTVLSSFRVSPPSLLLCVPLHLTLACNCIGSEFISCDCSLGLKACTNAQVAHDVCG